LGNARTILDVESIVGRPDPGSDRLRWQTHGVECSLTRHRFSGPEYAVSVEVLWIEQRRPGRPWQMLLVSELWRAQAVDLRATKWLKLKSGRPGDVAAWIAASRSEPDRTPLSRPVQGRI
jgi:hypothetical protein